MAQTCMPVRIYEEFGDRFRNFQRVCDRSHFPVLTFMIIWACQQEQTGLTGAAVRETNISYGKSNACYHHRGHRSNNNSDILVGIQLN